MALSTRWISGALAAAALACGARQHMSAQQGRAYHAVTAAQAPARARAGRAVTGLDSQEAAIISDTYRKGLAPKEAQPKDQPVLIVAPPNPSYGPAQPLAPSVPK